MGVPLHEEKPNSSSVHVSLYVQLLSSSQETAPAKPLAMHAPLLGLHAKTWHGSDSFSAAHVLTWFSLWQSPSASHASSVHKLLSASHAVPAGFMASIVHSPETGSHKSSSTHGRSSSGSGHTTADSATTVHEPSRHIASLKHVAVHGVPLSNASKTHPSPGTHVPDSHAFVDSHGSLVSPMHAPPAQ